MIGRKFFILIKHSLKGDNSMKLKALVTISLLIFIIIVPQSAMADQINWHSDVKVGSVFTWKVTEVENATDLPTIASQIPTLNDSWQLDISSNPPTSGSDYIYDANNTVDYADFYVNDVMVNLTTLEYYELLLILMMILPVSYVGDDGIIYFGNFESEYIRPNMENMQQSGMWSLGWNLFYYYYVFREIGRASFEINSDGIMEIYNFESESGNMTAIYQGVEVGDSKDGEINFPELSVIFLAGIVIVLIKKAKTRKKEL